MKTKKFLACSALGVAAACMAIGGIALAQNTHSGYSEFLGKYNTSFAAFAEENETTQSAELLSSKYMISTDSRYMLVATAFNVEDVSAYSEVGYEYSVNRETAVVSESDTYYTGISVLNAESERTVYAMADIYPDVTATAMIVMEIEYDPNNVYTIQSYITPKEGEKTYGTQVMFDDTVWAPANGLGDGKIQTMPINSGSYIRILNGTGYALTTQNTIDSADLSWSLGAVANESGEYELGTIFERTNAIESGFYFTPCTPYRCEPDKKINFTYTVENLGTEDITIKLYQIDVSSSQTETDYGTDEITIQAGKSATFSLLTPLANYTNNNVLTIFKFLNASENGFKIGTYMYAERILGEGTLTLENAKFADGTTSKTEVKQDTVFTLEDISVNIPEGKKLAGWYDVNNKTVYSGESFRMIDKDITIAPYFDAVSYYNSQDILTGKLSQTGNLYGTKGGNPGPSGCYSVLANKTTGIVKDANGNYEMGSIYHFKGGTASEPTNTMAIGSHFLTQEGNGLTTLNSVSATITTTIQNFGTEELTLRIAFLKSSSNTSSQFCEETVTISAGESITFDMPVTYLHGSFMMNVMVKDHAVSEVYIGAYQYITETKTA